MTHQNKAREALEWFNSHYCKSECSHYETIRRALTILERLDGVDRAALREAVERHNRFCNDENAKASDIYLDGQMGADSELFRQAARIVADMGE